MEKRTCQKCGIDNYSADTTKDWECCICKQIIDKPKEQKKVSSVLVLERPDLIQMISRK